MVRDHSFQQMDKNTQGNLFRELKTAMGPLSTTMATYTTDIFKMTDPTASEPCLTHLINTSTLETGLRDSRQARAKSSTQMDLTTLEALIEASKAEKVRIFGPTMHFIMVIGRMDLYMDKAPTHGQMGRHTPVLGL